MISIKNLSVKFGNFRVLTNVNMDFQNKKVHGILGLNGAGKTTFFNVLAKTLRPDNGEIYLDAAPIVIKNTAYLETVNYFYPGITGKEYLKIFHLTNLDFNLDLLQQYFKLPLDELIENYSTGMKKKLALLAVLKLDRPIFILDEPFNGLDLEINKILEIIIEILRQKGKTVFVSSHIIEPLITVSDEIHLLENQIFRKTFGKKEFNSIENEIFGKLKLEAKGIISKAV
jgi:ABC-2 type transport system ATP-binding protein